MKLELELNCDTNWLILWGIVEVFYSFPQNFKNRIYVLRVNITTT